MHQYVDSELAHLERMLPSLLDGPFPISYWRLRLESIAKRPMLPSQNLRYTQLKKKFQSLAQIPVAA